MASTPAESQSEWWYANQMIRSDPMRSKVSSVQMQLTRRGRMRQKLMPSQGLVTSSPGAPIAQRSRLDMAF